MVKKPNYLATPLERQRQLKVPAQQKINELLSLTDKIRQAWKTSLSDEILDTLMVVACDAHSMVITTNNHTIANHLNYSYQLLLPLIHHHYPYLETISHLKFKVIALSRYSYQHPALVDPKITPSLQDNNSVKNVTSRKLSATTRQNIAQLAQDVTHDSRLANILKRLASDDEN